MSPMYMVYSAAGSSYGEQPTAMAKCCIVWDDIETSLTKTLREITPFFQGFLLTTRLFLE